MINLIPPAAKKKIVREYWFRVISVWFFLIGSAFLLIALTMVPVFVLVTSQLEALTNTDTTQVEEMQAFQDIKTEVEFANSAAALLTTDTIEMKSHELARVLEELTSAKVAFVGFTATRDRQGFSSVTVRGIAFDRAALVAYQEAIINHEFFSAAELPLSNFAERADISFTMEITVAEDV